MSKLNLHDKVQAWWDSMDDNYKYEMMEGYYPDRSHLMDLNEMWKGIGWENQLEIYNNSEGEVDSSEEERRDIVGDIEAHHRMVEGDEII